MPGPMVRAMKLHLEGETNPVTAVITYQGQRYTYTSKLLYVGQIDGMPCGDRWITDEIRVAFHRADETIVATVYDHADIYELRPS